MNAACSVALRRGSDDLLWAPNATANRLCHVEKVPWISRVAPNMTHDSRGMELSRAGDSDIPKAGRVAGGGAPIID